ncbi:hypothetical protein GE115_09615 [Agromyces sp. CFH 90414]|uniref:Uncharacterized protein n=1 Tax=Agromyces agglutinans TaxID=2662258 RepID=A0A6I2FCD1_9MICO|nr:DUF6338 family protein [Agromyces agglutinans]MRG60126.1 hypothetical protein [Agromyces agglutinans]
MNVPESLPQIAAFVLMLVPGLTWAVVKTWLVGIRDPDYGAGARVLDALFISAVFIVVYGASALVIFVFNYSLEVAQGVLERAYSTWPSWAVASALLGLLVVIPGVASYFVNRRRVDYEVTSKRSDGSVVTKTKTKLINKPESFPTAWDMAAYEGITVRWVRVRLDKEVYFGGLFGQRSYVSTYPHGRDIFIEEQWELDKDGRFLREVDRSLGVWLAVPESAVVEWLDGEPTD